MSILERNHRTTRALRQIITRQRHGWVPHAKSERYFREDRVGAQVMAMLRTSHEAYRERRERQAQYLGHWSDEARTLYKDILEERIDTTEYVKACITEQEFTIEVLQVVLHAERRKAFMMKRAERLEKLHKGNNGELARPILTQIWSDHKIWRPLLECDQTAMFMLCYLAINADLEDYIREWIQVSDVSTGSVHGGWRSKLLRHLVEAHLASTADQSADRAIKCFFEMAHLAKVERRRNFFAQIKGLESHQNGLLYLSLTPALDVLCGTLLSNEYGNTDACLYDETWSCFGGYDGANHEPTARTRIRYHYLLAGSRLFHPESPTYEEAISFLRIVTNHKKPTEIRGLLPAPKHSIQIYFRRIVELARDSGKLEDAIWTNRLLKQMRLNSDGKDPVVPA
ncbi:hypothetical protein AC578_8089 [Pseudocercospora eumusae]|uniref:Uncharacterized protein n=1 Tax=Pseudocercospora eumusae TaxID=321146 RepID=A0A139H0J4_9PEZI|nr:hypothetical protein AC578_8089 [Pseudocercospora eumusae]